MTSRMLLAGSSAVVAAISSCHSYETQVTVHDPSRVRLDAKTTTGRLEQVLEPSSTRQSANFWAPSLEALMPSIKSTMGSQAVSAIRRDDGKLELQCKSMACSGAMTLMHPDGRLEPAGVEASALFVGGEVHIPLRWEVAGGHLTPTLVTDRSNVKSIRETKTPERAWGGLLVPGAIFTFVGYLIRDEGSIGTVMLGGGIALDGLGAYQLFYPAQEREVPVPPSR